MRNHVNAIANVNVQVGNQAIVRVIRNLETRCSMKRCAMSGRDSRPVDLEAPRFLEAGCFKGWRSAYSASHSLAYCALSLRSAARPAAAASRSEAALAEMRSADAEMSPAFAGSQSSSCAARHPGSCAARHTGATRLASPTQRAPHGGPCVLGKVGTRGFGKRFG